MKKYMVVCTAEGDHAAMFFDAYEDARQAKQDVECGLGGYAEIYERESEGGYVFLEA